MPSFLRRCFLPYPAPVLPRSGHLEPPERRVLLSGFPLQWEALDEPGSGGGWTRSTSARTTPAASWPAATCSGSA